MRVGYEWDIETSNRDGDDITHNHRDRLRDFGGEELTQALGNGVDDNGNLVVLVLVRTEDGGDRLWAYINADVKLPEFFSDSLGRETDVRVPKRFHREFAL